MVGGTFTERLVIARRAHTHRKKYVNVSLRLTYRYSTRVMVLYQSTIGTMDDAYFNDA